MRIDLRLLVLAAVAALALCAAQAADAAESLRLTEIRGARFPERSWVLSLPTSRPVSQHTMHLTEDGVEVGGLQVEPGDAAGPRTFGVVLVIDASGSMRGRAIEDAMAAARAFAARRRPNQPLGVVFFSRETTVALAPTTDGARIDEVLARTPPLRAGTSILDATDAAVAVLRREGITAGSVVILSDGADSGSMTTTSALASRIRQVRARVFSIGLRSDTYEGTTLERLAAMGGGEHVEASSSKDLAGIFDDLGERLGNQYLVTYRSLAPLGERVEVRARVDGLAGSANAVYQAPALAAASSPDGADRGGWSSPYLPVALALLVSAATGFFTFVLFRRGPRSARSRIAGFLGEPQGVVADEPRRRGRPRVLTDAERSLKRLRPWAAFEEEVELARVEVSPMKLAGWTLAATLVLAYLVAVPAGLPLLGVATLALPVGVRAAIRVRVSRERRAFGDQLAEDLQVLASAMRAGHSFLGSLAVMVDDAGEPSRREFQRVLNDEQLGVPIHEALATVARRMRNPDVEYIGLVAQLQTETGGNTAEVLDRVTETIRERNGLQRLVRTLTAQGRLGGWVVSLMPVGLVLALTVINPDYLDPLLRSGGGQALLAVGAGCVIAGMLAIRRIVDIRI